MSDPKTKQCTVYFDEYIHRALKLKSAGTNRSISDVVNEAVKSLLAEDHQNLMAFEAQDYEPIVSYEDLLNDLKSEGKI
ncbi:MAG: CopG family transcriptional regulator [Zetaproteobacteria bacterium CG12_big_fil_rev_8_21_14_0_65_54_13]|nr:MAG: CopG family transcriptional regulator [Zetaproteobacteria bacterium CG23_combo_of_CG06-09_8_20_14_all_54_7]PIW46275.1 MAG: CopG family transcriptional regulator [Zetaproteobacteria bacterium CG12_big_fil_rev_8_21_14_0_65_54_13]PIX54868.1 MAG: CopG family transcriptional regulator [Zetaproteobacteria bacterium CG_4_10_14_3_um_filter_54_28]PJA30335.1 MAG: CopG family transcriptional regulator [Zetaproteobacteria bacterium CG_4_9_14_3_um_filter_54_145]